MRNGKENPLISFILFFVPFFLILYYWKNILLNITTHLYDWRDVPFVIWAFQNNIKSIGLFDFIYHHDTNAMYPFPYSLSFTEHMYFPSFLIYFLSLFTKNPILQFNILAILNHVLIYVSSWLLASRFTKNAWIKASSAFFMAFSPYFFIQSGHFQMVFFWPLLLSLYFLLHPERQLQHLLVSGLFLAWQFMSAIYLGLMGLFVIASYYLIMLVKPGLFPLVRYTKKELEVKGKAFLFGFKTKWDDMKPESRMRIAGELLILLIAFLIVSEPTLEAYFEMNSVYKPSIEQGQYVNFAAHISDYLFPSNQNSLLYRFLGFWRGLNRHMTGEPAAFVGFVPLGIIGYAFLKSKRNKSTGSRWLHWWTLALIVVAFIFSLGPRFNFNGTYLVTPLPYLAVLKTVPLIGVMRALARWYFVIILALFMLMAFGMTRMKKALLPVLFILLVLEFYPAPLQSSAYPWNTKVYGKVREICKENPNPMLEYPFDYRAQNAGEKDLTYKNTILLASTTHNCDILSGFTAYQPKKYIEYRDFLQNRDFNRGGIMLLYNLGFRYIKFNKFAMNEKEKTQIARFVKLRYTTKLYEDDNTIIVGLRQLTKYEMIETIR